MLPSQAVAISTQSSLASLPAMLQSSRALGVRETTADFVLPLAVALFRATGPVMNLGVAIYVAQLAGVELTPSAMAAGIAVALLTTIASVSLPGAISFVTAIGPIAIAMGVPVEPLALLVAVEMLPDLMRTLGNVTMDVAVTATVDRTTVDGAGAADYRSFGLNDFFLFATGARAVRCGSDASRVTHQQTQEGRSPWLSSSSRCPTTARRWHRRSPPRR